MTDWKPLPELQGKRAIRSTEKAQFSSHLSNATRIKSREIFSKKERVFSGKVEPKTIKDIQFKQSEILKLENRTSIPTGLVFKDLSTSNIKYLDKTHGLFDNNVVMMAENKDGLIYLGTGSGLAVYNDMEISIYQDPETFSFEKIRSLFYDSQHRLWIGTELGICYIQNDKLYLPSRPIFGTTHFKGFYEHARSGELFIFTSENGLFILKDNDIVHYSHSYSDDFSNANYFDVIRGGDERIWIASDRGIGFIKQDSLFMYKDSREFNMGTSLFEMGNEVWIGSFFNSPLKFRNDSLLEIEIGENTKNRVYSMSKNDHGLWMTDYSAGVYLFQQNGEIQFFNTQKGLAGNNAYSLMIDSYNNIWVADSYKGISRIEENLFYKKEVPIEATERISDIEKDEEGNILYFSTGQLLIETAENFTVVKGGGGYYSDGFASDEKIWISDLNNGLAKLSDGFFTYYHPDTDKGGFIPHQIQPDGQGGIWGRDGFSRLHRFYEDSFYNFTDTEIWKDYLFDNVVATRSGTIFLMTRNNGVIAVRANRFSHMTSETGLVADRISYVHEEADGTFWFCTDGRIQVVKNGVSRTFYVPELAGNTISDIIEEKTNQYLATTQNGILSIVKVNEDPVFKFYDKSYGLGVIENFTIGKSIDDAIVIGGKEGHLMTFDPAFLNHRPPPKLTVNRIVLNDSLEFSANSNLNFEQDQSLEFVFNKINWGQKSTLSYRLDHGNQEGRWNEVSANKVTFQELAYGDYQLRVYVTGLNRKSEELDFNFTILPFWYQTNLARIALILLLALSIIGYFLIREHRARIERKRLEKLVTEKTAELQVEKDEVTKQLAQKEILIQEVHHRVKNNLTFLKSLLYLRADETDDKEVSLVLDECQARIHSMALVHQNLYDVDDATEVDFESFLKELFVELEIMFDQDTNHIDLVVKANNLKVDMKLSVFLGLIINEMITNSFKYAFNDGAKGRIDIVLRDNGKTFELRYADNGVGLPEGYGLQTSTGFGFKLINILLNQVDGQISYLKNELSTFLVVIPK